MCSKAALLTLLGLALVSARAEPPAARLEVAPVQCVALHRGQICHFEARVAWQASAAAPYCLFGGSPPAAAPLHCWPRASAGRLSLPMQAGSDVEFELRRQGEELALARTRVEIAWVYRTTQRPRGSWRLF